MKMEFIIYDDYLQGKRSRRKSISNLLGGQKVDIRVGVL